MELPLYAPTWGTLQGGVVEKWLFVIRAAKDRAFWGKEDADMAVFEVAKAAGADPERLDLIGRLV